MRRQSFTVYHRARKISGCNCPYDALGIARALGPGWRIESADETAAEELNRAMGGKPVFRRDPDSGRMEKLQVESGQYRSIVNSRSEDFCVAAA